MAGDFLSQLRPTPILTALLGAALLVVGRRLFWIFVGAVGFIAGLEWGATVIGKQPETVRLIFALAVGVVGAVLAVFLQRFAVALAGGVIGGMFFVRLAETAGFAGQSVPLFAFILGAVLAALLVLVLFDWALIIFSSLAGGTVLADLFVPQRTLEMIVALILCIVGIVVQSRGRAPGG
jgi:hypothetical protein